MPEESPGNEIHAERVRQSRHALPPGSKRDWPKNLSELLEWLGLEVEDVSKAAQLRLQEATKVVSDCAKGEIDLEQAARRLDAYNDRWRDVFHRGVRHVRGMTDEEIYKALDETPNQNRESGPSR
jgi:hypothetical protein